MPTYKPEKHASPVANVLITIIILVAVVVVVYYAYFAPQPPKIVSQIPFLRPNDTAIRDAYNVKLEDKYFINTLEYYDRNLSFSLRYPIGYLAIKDPLPGVIVRFSAFYPPESAEVMDVVWAEKAELSPEAIRSTAVQADVAVNEYEQDGKKIYSMLIRQPNPVDANQTIFVKEAFYECRDYWLVFVAGISAPLAPDLELADYMISTMRC